MTIFETTKPKCILSLHKKPSADRYLLKADG
jgi:hypothetical protein